MVPDSILTIKGKDEYAYLRSSIMVKNENLRVLKEVPVHSLLIVQFFVSDDGIYNQNHICMCHCS